MACHGTCAQVSSARPTAPPAGPPPDRVPLLSLLLLQASHAGGTVSSALEVIELLPPGELLDVADLFNDAWSALDLAADRLRHLVAGGNPQLAHQLGDGRPALALLDRVLGRFPEAA